MKKILVLLLCFNIVLAPTYAFANTSLFGWTITSQVAQGASTLINATKNVVINGANVVKTSTAKITPTASQVGKVLGRGVAGYALSVAVEQLLGSVDWVLDPANNQIKYKELGDLIYSIDANSPGWDPAKKFASHADLCRSYVSTYNSNLQGATIEYVSSSNSACVVNQYDKNGNKILSNYSLPITTAQDAEEKKISLDTVASQVISNAESETDQQKKAGAQSATTAAAQDMLANDAATQSDVETQLNTNAKTQTSEQAAAEATPKDPAAPEAGTNIKITFPVFCGWAPIVCEAAQSAIKFPTTVENWWNTATQAISSSWTYFKEWLDWTKNDSELPETQTNEVTELPIPELQENAISWSASCPPDVQVPINLYGQSSTLTFSWSPWCQLLNIIKPAIIASAYIGAAFIVLGLRT